MQVQKINGMDIISHTLTGVAVGTVFAAVSNSSWKEKGLIVLTGAIGGALPDLDAISLWSKFDSTIGAFFNLKYSGKEIYSGKLWYSHHAFLHSILAPILMIMSVLIVNNIRIKKFDISKTMEYFKTKKYLYLTFFFAFLFHLLEDMPTPASVWGGVNLFYPSSSYIGGFGKIWWWNNYDLVLIIFAVIFINLIINIVNKKYHILKVRLTISVFLFGLSLFLFQINNRPVDFSYTGHTNNYDEFELQSKLIQKKILGDKLFEIMTKIDNKIPFNF